MANITNDISNLIGEMSWLIPADLADSGGSYVLEFEVVNSSSITNSRILTDNEFVIIPEGVGLFAIYCLSLIICYRTKSRFNI